MASHWEFIPMHWRRLIAGVMLGQIGLAQPLPNPPFTINHRVRTAEVNRGGRVNLEYDTTPWANCRLVVQCFRYQGPQGTSKVADWTVQGKGEQRLDFKKMPASQYLFTCTLQDPQGQEVPLAFRPVQLEYGGWSGRLRVAESTQRAALDPNAPLGMTTGLGQPEDAEYTFRVVPESLVVQPGSHAVLTATLNTRPVAEAVDWKLEGPGRLVIEENFICHYYADKDAVGERATIHAYLAQHPQFHHQVQVLINRDAVKSSESK